MKNAIDEARERREEARRYLANKALYNVRNKYPLCAFCSFTGLVGARHKEDGNVYAFRCLNCDSAMRLELSEKIPSWSDYTWGSKFERLGNQTL